MNIRFIETTVKENILFKQNPELRQYISNVIETVVDYGWNSHLYDPSCNHLLRPRIPRDILFVFGGWSASNASNIIESYDCRVNKWFSVDNQSLV